MTTPPISPLAPAPVPAPPLSRFDGVWTTPAMVSTGRGLTGYTPQFTIITTRVTADGSARVATAIQRDPALVSFESAYAAAYQPVAQRTYPLLPLLSTESLVRLLAWEEIYPDTYKRVALEGTVRWPSARQIRAMHRVRPRAALEADVRALAAESEDYSLFLHGILLPDRDMALEDIEEWARWHGVYSGLSLLEKMLAIFRVQQTLMASSKIVREVEAGQDDGDRMSVYLTEAIDKLSPLLYHDPSGIADFVEHELLTGRYLRPARGIREWERKWEELGAPFGVPLSPSDGEEEEEKEPVEEEEEEPGDEEGGVEEAAGAEDATPSESGYQTDSLDGVHA